jgi:mannose-1-phosphate guanylyltransferase
LGTASGGSYVMQVFGKREYIMDADTYPGRNVLPRMANHLNARWCIVLAGGDGTRMRPLIHAWFGGDRPKQYCTFVGSRSMIQHTLDRAHSIVSDGHVVTVIGQDHSKHFSESTRMQALDLVLEQPDNLGTAPGIFFPTAYVLANNPEAIIAFLPSDHYVHPEQLFCEQITQAYELVEKYKSKVLLVGAVPDRAETEYGWIDPVRDTKHEGADKTHKVMNVLRFREKPDAMEAQALFEQDCLWNTMVMVAKAKVLWDLGRQCLPEMMYIFDAFLMVLRAIGEKRLESRFESAALARVYKDLQPADFSRDILQHISERSMVMPMKNVAWCDWGHPQRVTASLSDIGRCPSFEPEPFGQKEETENTIMERDSK